MRRAASLSLLAVPFRPFAVSCANAALMQTEFARQAARHKARAFLGMWLAWWGGRGECGPSCAALAACMRPQAGTDLAGGRLRHRCTLSSSPPHTPYSPTLRRRCAATLRRTMPRLRCMSTQADQPSTRTPPLLPQAVRRDLARHYAAAALGVGAFFFEDLVMDSGWGGYVHSGGCWAGVRCGERGGEAAACLPDAAAGMGECPGWMGLTRGWGGGLLHPLHPAC